MAKATWMYDGKKAGPATVTAILAGSRAAKLQRMAEIREALVAEGRAFADERALDNAVRKRWCEEDRERREREAHFRRVGAAARKALRDAERKPLYVYAEPLRDGDITEREIRALDLLFGFPKRSITKPDGLSSFHCKFTSRGLGSRRSSGRSYSLGEALKHVRYILREAARELSQGGIASNISLDPDAVAGFFAALEELETHDRDNAHVYTSLVISLPHELSPEGRERLLAEICEEFAQLGLPHVGVLHAPDPGRDQRNFHAHIMFSQRPFEALGAGNYEVSADKYSHLNDATFIEPFRHRVAVLMNEAMAREGYERRFTALSDADRGLAPRSKRSGKRTIGESNRKRKQEALAAIRVELAARRRLDALGRRIGELLAPITASPPRDVQAELRSLRARMLAGITAAQEAIVERRTRRDHDLARLAAKVARAQPAPQPGTPSVPDEAWQAAIDEAAAVLMRMPYPRQTRVGGRFKLVKPVGEALEAADRFEAEPAIQQAHRVKWDALVRELGTAIGEAGVSPILHDQGRLRLKKDGIHPGLHAWYHEARHDTEIFDLIRRWDRAWKEREDKKKAAAAAAEAERRRGEAHREKLVRELVARSGTKVLNEAPGDRHEQMRQAIRTVATAATEGRMFVMVGREEAALYFEAPEARTAATDLARSSSGRELILALAKLAGPPSIDSGRRLATMIVQAAPTHQKPRSAKARTRHSTRAGPER